ncbi:MAG: Leucyl/phenylalanyl-tRNA--protein transferase [Rhodanobacteraceae bacterium]|jgi:leucyl/phenylalanyl-tRNA--protein transferase|nr:MAG: Leucyl/phenylalanyl-tRNA--protein transferase [Rhodanobacteraceae bacterium]
MTRIQPLDAFAPDVFPDPATALADPNGLLAFGGDLSPQRLLAAYSHGVFPWYSEGDPLLWWSPDPRCVFATDGVHLSHSLAKFLRKCEWTWSMNLAFDEVMRACAGPRAGQSGTWITPDMLTAYNNLHLLGHAHSLEIWDADTLIGGIYGVVVGRMFSAESMFSLRTNASKLALHALANVLREHGFPWIDAQVPNPHLMRMGARTIPRRQFLEELARLAAQPAPRDWPRSRSPVRSG